MKIRLLLATLASATAIAFSVPASAEDVVPSGTTQPAASNDSAPVSGANSFTESQAKTRIQDAGYANVTALAKDDQGVWRGEATKDGRQVAVALDYQGNVVAGAK